MGGHKRKKVNTRNFYGIFLICIIVASLYLIFHGKYVFLIVILLSSFEFYYFFKKRKMIVEEMIDELKENYRSVVRYKRLYGHFIFGLLFLFLLYKLNVPLPWIVLLFTAGFVLFYSQLVFKRIEDEESFGPEDYVVTMAVFVVFVIFLFGIAYLAPLDGNYLLYGNGEKYDGDIFSSIYFSGVTFFSLGYGDIVPYGSSYRLFSLLEVFLGVFFIVTFFAFGLNLTYEKLKYKKWNPIRESAYGLMESKLWNLSYDMLRLFRDESDFVTSSSHEESYEKLMDAFDKEQIKRIKKLAHEDVGTLSQKVDRQDIVYAQKYLNYERMFRIYHEEISNLELKYGDYMGVEERLILIKIQEELNNLCLAFKTEKWFGGQMFERNIAVHSKKILMEIDKAAVIKIIKK